MTERSRLGRDPLAEAMPAQESLPTTEAVVADPAQEPLPTTEAVAADSSPICPQRPRIGSPMASFLSGVLESILPEPGPRLWVDVAPEAACLSGEKFFFVSRALQLLLSPVDLANILGHRPRPVSACADANLWVRLESREDGAVVLRLYDDGNCLQHFFPDVSLDMESLRPLRLFLAKRNGSFVVKQGRCLEFDIIG